ncbi:unnamed protein product, partial [Didymodactylos carnosus]
MASSGQCLCGQISVTLPQGTLNDKTENVRMCRCNNCRQVAGSLFTYNIVLPKTDVKIQGEPKAYEDKNTDSGDVLLRRFCPNCGSRIYGTNSKYPDRVVVSLGLFDQSPKPSVQLYCKNRPEWEKQIDGCKDFEAMPTQ